MRETPWPDRGDFSGDDLYPRNAARSLRAAKGVHTGQTETVTSEGSLMESSA